MQQMRCRMILPDRVATRMVHFECQRSITLDFSLLDGAEVHEKVAGFLLRIGNAYPCAVGSHAAGIAGLPAGFGIERRLIEHDRAVFSLFQGSDFLAVAHERSDDALRLLRFVTEELGGPGLFAYGEPDRLRCRFAGAGPGRARLLPLPFHRGIEPLDIDAYAARSQRVLSEVERKSISVVQGK